MIRAKRLINMVYKIGIKVYWWLTELFEHGSAQNFADDRRASYASVILRRNTICH